MHKNSFQLKIEIKKDLVDLQMERVRLRTEAEMVEQAILALEVKYAEGNERGAE